MRTNITCAGYVVDFRRLEKRTDQRSPAYQETHNYTRVAGTRGNVFDRRRLKNIRTQSVTSTDKKSRRIKRARFPSRYRRDATTYLTAACCHSRCATKRDPLRYRPRVYRTNVTESRISDEVYANARRLLPR